MSKQFASDLRLARRKSGFSQRDVGHLLRVHASRVSDLEHAVRLPTVIEFAILSLVFGRSFGSLWDDVLEEARAKLRQRVITLPEDGRSHVATRNRPASVDRLARRLAEET